MKKSLEKNRCGYCEKVFCCIECRRKHEKKNHPVHGPNCLFCRRKDVQTRYFEDPEFLCHVVINHLPLYCKFCGDEFRSIEDLQSLGRCRLWSVKKTLLVTPSPLGTKTSGPLKTYTRKEGSLDGEYTGNFGSFTSPPELSRNTSTPMHGEVVRQNTNCEYKIAKTPNFSFKTPKTPSLTERKAEDSQNVDGSSKDSWDTHFVSFSQLWKANSKGEDTPLRSALPFSQRVRGQDSRKEGIINSGWKLGAMQEEVQDMELTDVQGSDILLARDINGGELPTPPDVTSGSNKSKKERRESIKRVRFSDQFITTGSFDITENEFYDARETMADSMSTGQSSLNKAQMNRENERNAEKENIDSNEIPPKHSPETNSRLASSSRVVMMVLVENTGELSPSSLAPLIDSSIRKLEERSSESIYSSVISNLSASQTSASKSLRRSTSLDSYRQSSVKHFSNSPEVSTKSQVSEISAAGGIFSAVAQAMKYAFSNLTGVGTFRNICREPISQSAKSLSRSWTSESILVTPPSTSSVVSRKRPRDIVDIMPTRQRDTPETESESWSPLAKRQRGWYKIKAREPIARMRTLEANQAAVTRGVSSETQRFTQGSLSVGDTVLPIPARAHQSTQTD
ncbi:uncharacterized protein LOC107271224 [Cephus cinctus]|uniref:Uncharacterized protein LOC107271224 n=1 Tax=Cephus cinctus TaxID=211228 RepID=A0AAJ7FPW1_CEPCN|nr:uncharacterized protein LOC107271224 [Cephus cinctus]